MNDEIATIIAYITVSTYRERVLITIGDEFKTPTQIAHESDIRTNHISKVLKELKDKGLVVCINEEAKKGRVYRLTELGHEILEEIE